MEDTTRLIVPVEDLSNIFRRGKGGRESFLRKGKGKRMKKKSSKRSMLEIEKAP